jgi:hypothetical protein
MTRAMPAIWEPHVIRPIEVVRLEVCLCIKEDCNGKEAIQA